MDLFDISEGYPSMEDAFSKIKCPALIMGSSSDILFPVTQQREIAKCLKESGNKSVVYYEIDSLFGKFLFSMISISNFSNDYIRNHVLEFQRPRHIFD